MNATATRIRWLIRRDLPEVLRIERRSFVSPWNQETFLAMIRRRNVMAMVADDGERVLGYMVYQLDKTRINVLNFAVAPKCRRQGVGRQMCDKLAAKLVVNPHRTRVVFEVTEGNLRMQLFLRACGFRCVNVIRGGREDGYLFVKRVSNQTTE